MSLNVIEYRDGVSFHVRVTPRARRNSIDGIDAGVLKIRVTAPPDQGKANAALIELLASFLGVKRSQVAILAGQTSRSKVLRVSGITHDKMGSLLLTGQDRTRPGEKP